MRKLAGGTTFIAVGRTYAVTAFQALGSGQTINATGTYAPLAWDARGAAAGGTVEVWCIGASGNVPYYGSSGLTFDVKTQQFAGTYTPCL
jgi:hypothetical protein